MIARMWRGATAKQDANDYIRYLQQTGLKGYRETPGNRGAWIFWREDEERAEFLTVSLWESEDAIARFAGDDIGRAVFYPEDDRYLVDRETTVSHFLVVSADDP
jgi:heme-degrading monooxygenase HmoA